MSIKILSLDLSISSTGFSVFIDGDISTSGIICPQNYPGRTKDRYPKRSINDMASSAEQILGLIISTDPDIILIEEINSSGRKNVISTKGLAGIHYVLFYFMICYDDSLFSKIRFITTSQWRGALGLKKNKDWKQASVDHVNKTLGTTFSHDENDITDSICCYLGASKLGIDNL